MNFGTPVPLLIGIVLILGGVALFFVDRLKPGYGRDSDKVYAVLWLISGVFLLGHLNMELLASFQQLMMAGMLITLTIQNVYSRTPKEDRYAAQTAGGRDDYYRPSRPQPDYRGSSPRMNVRAELDNEGPYRPRFPEDRRMIGGRDEPPRRSDYYDDGYGDRYGGASQGGGYPDRSMPPNDRPVERLNPSGDRIRRRRSKPGDARYGIPPARGWDESAGGYAANSGGYSANSGSYGADSYSANAGSGYSAASADDYVGSGGYSSHAAPDSGNAPANGNAGDDSYVDYRPVNNYPNDDAGQPPADYGSRQY